MFSKKATCCILGDSISQGIGKKRINYIPYLNFFCDENIEIINYSMTGTTIKYVDTIFSSLKDLQPYIIVVMYGSVDAQIRANIWRNRGGLCNIIPKRYKGGGMLEPRAIYSRKWYRFISDRIDNIIRFILKKYVLLTQGKIQFISKDEFYEIYTKTIKQLKTITNNIILVSTVYIDDHYFLDSSKEYEEFNKIINNIALKNNIQYVDVYSHLKKKVLNSGWDEVYLKDHFHPNIVGYKLIASLIGEALRKIIV